MKPTDSPHRPGHGPGHVGHGHGGHGHADPRQHGSLDNVDVAHEHGDINVRAILMFLVGFAVISAVVFLLMWGTFVGLDRMAAANDPQVSPVALPAGQLPPEPRLLTNEPAQLRTFREEEARMLSGGTDPRTGATMIPIEEAKKRLLQQGLPVRQGATADPLLGTRAPARGESSSGRMLGVR